MPAVPADSDPLARRPSGDTCADRIDDAGDLVSRDARVLDAGPESLFGQGVAVADAASFDADAYGSDAGIGDFAFREFHRALGAVDLHNPHG